MALELARAAKGVIINADSMQVYRELRVLSARPTAQDEAAVPHRLYGHVAATEAYSVGRWLEEVAIELAAARQAGHRPILVGGTGLYFKALLEGLAPVPDVPDDIRARWRARSKELETAQLHDELAARDPVMAERLRPSDPQRIVRALEVFEATGQSLSVWQETPAKPLLDPANVKALVIAPDREVIYARCDSRVAAMLDHGALDEVAGLMKVAPDPGLPALRALGVGALMDHLVSELSLEEASDRLRTETRRYAKRQLTWLRSNMITWKWFFEKDMVRMIPEIFAFVDV